MGKVRVKTLGIEEIEEEQKESGRKRKEAKREKKLAKGAHGGERVVSMAPTEEELAKVALPPTTAEAVVGKKEETKAAKVRPSRKRSANYREKLMLIDRKKAYGVGEALELLRKVSLAKFDGTVELHINVVEKGLSGRFTLPHKTGKKVHVAIASEALISEVEKGKIDFDVLVAEPSMMPKLAKVAKILGPRGLMPNPKTETISEEPAELAKKFQDGQMHFKTESQAPIIHLVVGKLSMKDEELLRNIEAVLTAIGPAKIKRVTLKSTMSPGIKVDFSS